MNRAYCSAYAEVSRQHRPPGESEWGPIRFKDDYYVAEFVRVEDRPARGYNKCGECEFLEHPLAYEPTGRSGDERAETCDALSPEEAKAKLFAAFNRVADAMDVAWEEGELTPDGIKSAIIDFRRDHPYHDE